MMDDLDQAIANMRRALRVAEVTLLVAVLCVIVGLGLIAVLIARAA